MRHALTLVLLLTLTACDIPAWMGGKRPVKRAPGERVDVVMPAARAKPDEEAQATPIEIPEQADANQWLNRNEAMLSGHLALGEIDQEQAASIGEGNEFSRESVPSPIVASNMVVAMDAAGVISAHKAANIEELLWTNASGQIEDIDDMLGGGLAYKEGVVYAATGYGRLLAIDAATGKTKWKSNIGAPVRGAPAVGDNLVVVITADNQTLAFDATLGGPRWEHRGIRESAGYFSNTSPVISEGIVVTAYSSGELFAIRAETGNVLWNDELTSSVRTHASAVFSGIDADPVVQDGVVLVAGASGLMQASALLNGRPLWQQKIGAHMTPWSAGNTLFVLTDTHDIAALLKRNGAVRWSKSLAKEQNGLDVTPALFGPILAGGKVLVMTSDGILLHFDPESGEHKGDLEIAEGIATPPVVANGALYVISKDAVLHKYY